MKINKDNYPVYLIDYLEGSLAESDRQLVERFLSEHPDLATEMDGILEMRLGGLEVEYPFRHTLMHADMGMSLLEQLCVAELEGDLTPHEQQQLQALAADTDLARERRLTALTRLVAPAIEYPHRASLRRQQRLPMWWLSSAAAALMVGLLVWGISTRTPQTDGTADATVNKKGITRQSKPGAATEENKKLASNDVQESPSIPASEFLIEFEEVSMQLDQAPEVASEAVFVAPQVQQALPMLPKVPAADLSAEGPSLSQKTIDDNAAYLRYWTNQYLRAQK